MVGMISILCTLQMVQALILGLTTIETGCVLRWRAYVMAPAWLNVSNYTEELDAGCGLACRLSPARVSGQ
jgi:hypothetical protein